jgi:hypothetical protein
VIECLDLIESFLVRRAIVGIEPTGLLVMFKSLWNNMNGIINKEDLKNQIEKRGTTEWPSNERLYTAITTRNIYSSHICKYLLIEYDKSLDHDVATNEFWIEHVLPQKLNKVWGEVITQEDHQKVYNTWGNLIPLTKEMNQEVSQSEYNVKKDQILEQSVFASARKLFREHQKWDKDTIELRNKLIYEWAINRWGK